MVCSFQNWKFYGLTIPENSATFRDEITESVHRAFFEDKNYYVTQSVIITCYNGYAGSITT